MIYLKAEQSSKVYQKDVALKDIATIFCSEEKIQKELENLKVYKVDANVTKEKKYAFSIVYVLELIHQQFPEENVFNLGASEFVICYIPKKKPKKIFEIGKVVVVCFLIFFGSAFTIMTFNEDASLREIFDLLYGLFNTDQIRDYKLLEWSYSIGIPIGTIVFFNHFTRLKMDDDPTPLQIQMRLYEGDEMTTIIENSSREQRIVESEEDRKSKKSK